MLYLHTLAIAVASITPVDVLDAIATYLPFTISVLVALGMRDSAIRLGRRFTKRARAMAAATPNKVDDVVVDVICDKADAAIDLVFKDPARAVEELKKLRADVERFRPVLVPKK